MMENNTKKCPATPVSKGAYRKPGEGPLWGPVGTGQREWL